jgi:hypothetical protein
VKSISEENFRYWKVKRRDIRNEGGDIINTVSEVVFKEQKLVTELQSKHFKSQFGFK